MSAAAEVVCSCAGCGDALVTKVLLGLTEDGWEVFDFNRSLFCATVVTRRREHPSEYSVSVPDKQIHVTEYPVVCSRACFDKIVAEWQKCDPLKYSVGERTTVDDEVVELNWGSKYTLEEKSE